MNTNKSNLIQSELNTSVPLNENIQIIQSMHKDSLNRISSELLYNELKKNKSEVSIPLFEGQAPTIDLLDVGKTNKKYEVLKKNTIENNQNVKNNNLNSLYLTTNLNEELKEILTPKNNSTHESNDKISNSQSLLPYLNSFTQFNKNTVKHQHLLYQFKKANNKSYKNIFDKTTKLLNLTFLAMGCLMSKPVYKVIYSKNDLEFEHDTPFQSYILEGGSLRRKWSQKIVIDLSYFIRKNKHRYLHNNVEVNDQIIHISHPDNINTASIEYLNSSSNVNTHLVNSISQDLFNKEVQSSIQPCAVNTRNNILCKYNDRFKMLSDHLNSVFNSEVELNLVRLHKVFYDSQILVQDIALKSYKFRFVKLVSKLFKKVQIQKMDYSNKLNNFEGLSTGIPSYLSGINIKLAGRTFRQRVIPRMTVKRIQKGSLTNVNVQLTDRARFTGKTKRGAYSFTITLGHVFK